MKRRTLTLTLVAGALVFLVVLALYLPASWFASLLPPQVRCAELGGSVWSGECIGLEAQGTRLGNATWDLSPLRALTGRLVGDVQVQGPRHRVVSNIDLGFDGSGTARQASGYFPLDPEFMAQMARDQRGQVTFSFEELQLEAGQLKGMPGKSTLNLSDFRLVFPTQTALGSYEVVFDGPAQPDGSRIGQLRSGAGSPFGLEGKVTFTPPNQYLVEGLIMGHTAQARDIVRQITLGAPPDASGRNEIRFEGTF